MHTTTVHASVPVKWDDERHPLGATPDTWIDVNVAHPEGADWYAIDEAARLALIQHTGRDGWASTFADDTAWATYRDRYTTTEAPAATLFTTLLVPASS